MLHFESPGPVVVLLLSQGLRAPLPPLRVEQAGHAPVVELLPDLSRVRVDRAVGRDTPLVLAGLGRG